jgi:RimJ/RimL family protein N-acetyltransferase
VLGLEEAGGLIGCVVATHDTRKGWINRLTIDPPYRRKGLGAELIRAAEAALREEGMTIIAALIEAWNEASLALFEKLGYRLDREVLYVSRRDSDAA